MERDDRNRLASQKDVFEEREIVYLVARTEVFEGRFLRYERSCRRLVILRCHALVFLVSVGPCVVAQVFVSVVGRRAVVALVVLGLELKFLVGVVLLVALELGSLVGLEEHLVVPKGSFSFSPWASGV